VNNQVVRLCQAGISGRFPGDGRQGGAEEQQKLENAFLKQAKPFEVRRFLKMRAMEILKNIAFMDFIAMDHACVSP